MTRKFKAKLKEYKQRIASMPPTDLAYIAGFIDGEGSVSIRYSPDSQKRCGAWILELKISSTNKEILGWLRKRVMGCINIKKLRNPRCKYCWQWRLGGFRSVELLRAIFPYLKIKNKQALIAFEFGSTFRHHTGTSLTPKTILRRRALKKTMNGLNARGQVQTKI